MNLLTKSPLTFTYFCSRRLVASCVSEFFSTECKQKIEKHTTHSSCEMR